MNSEAEIKLLEKNRRRSRRAIPVTAGLLVGVAAIGWILDRFFEIPIWVALIVVGILAFSLLGDVLNLFFSRRRIRKFLGRPEHGA